MNLINQPSTSTSLSALTLLERFVVDNDELLELESLIGKFNIFNALRIERNEIRHSNFLAFILDPAESHGQGQLFLKAVLMDLLRKALPDKRPLSPIELEGIDLRGVDVQREAAHIDLLIACREPPFVVVVENKIGAHEHSGQLGRYEATIKTQYNGVRPLYVFLTPDADEPSKDNWLPYSYADLYRVLARVRAASSNSIGDDVLVFLDHYLSLIGTRFMNDKKIDELCQRIYKNHRHALQLIFERIGSPGSGVLADVEAVVRSDARWHVFYRTGDRVDFVPTSWLEWLPDLGLDRKDAPKSWLILRIELYAEKLDLYVEVRRMADAAKRKKIA